MGAGGVADYHGFFELLPKAQTFATQADAQAFYSGLSSYGDVSASGKVIFDNYLVESVQDNEYKYHMYSEMAVSGQTDKEVLTQKAADLHGGWMETYTVASTNGTWVAVPHANQASAMVVDQVPDCPTCNGRTTPHVRPTKAVLFSEHAGDVSTSSDGAETYRLKGDLHALNVWSGAPSATLVEKRFLAARQQLAASSGDYVYDQWRKAASFLVADPPMCWAEWWDPCPWTDGKYQVLAQSHDIFAPQPPPTPPSPSLPPWLPPPPPSPPPQKDPPHVPPAPGRPPSPPPPVYPIMEEYMWSDPEAWRLPGGGIPTCNIAAGCTSYGDLRIPTDRRIILDVDSPVLTKLIIAGELACKPGDTGLRTITADVIMIRYTGKFECGSAAAPHTGGLKLDISYGERLISVQYDKDRGTGGELKLFGAPKTPSWTRLAATAAAGATQLALQVPSGSAFTWAVGDRIVIAPSGFDQNEAEERTITAVTVDGAGATLTLDSGLSSAHEVLSETYGANGAGVNLRPEVTVLTRSIVMKGTPTNTQYPMPQCPYAPMP